VRCATVTNFRQRPASSGEHLILVKRDHPAVEPERRQRRIRRQELEIADAVQSQRPHHFALKRADGVAELRHAKARRDLGGHRGASCDRAPLEHQGRELLPGEQRGGHETVDAAADDDYIKHVALTCACPS
jgi:hypothetical protein